MNEIIPQVVYQLGAGGVLGFIVGYSIKKVAKILTVIAGLFTLALLFLEYEGIINVNYDKLLEAVENFTGIREQSSSLINPILAHLPFAGSFAVAAAIGFKVG